MLRQLRSFHKFHKWINCLLAVYTLLTVLQFTGTFAEEIYPLSQPQILVKNGHIYFIPAENKNLILKTSGRGKVVFNSVELDNLVGSIQNSSRDLNAFKRAFGSPASTSGSGQISSRITNIEQTIQRLNQIESLDSRLTRVERQLNNGTDSGGSGSNTLTRRLRRLKSRVEAIESQLSGVGAGNQNPCYRNPCMNGGKCIPTIYGAYCSCAEGWEGERCDQDVNECANFAGTELGCQNGATCVNRPGSYLCQCVSGYVGMHCTKRSGGCSSASAWELCGHGICVDQHGGPNPYTCICDVGWTHSSRSPICNVDIDECSQYHTTCSSNPPVSCINTPGSYICGPCPPGYTGNGHQCADINECLVGNGGCSTNPMVQCTNTIGSSNCGPCPPGYMGNGRTCQYVGMCQMNNGGCHPLARCVDNPIIGQSFVQCVCPAGYTGTGMGLHGCIPVHTGGGGVIVPTAPPGGNFCIPNPCQNGGVCHSYGVSYTCSCPPGFIGQNCGTRANPCLSQPCQNGGSCSQTTTGFTCSCTAEYAGDLCERQTESCGGYLTSEEGTLKFPQTQATYEHNAFCEWLLLTQPGKVFNVTFTNFHLEGGSSCSYDYLDIRDGGDSQSPLLGRFCGDELPHSGNILTTHNSLHLTFRSDHNVLGLGFELTWNTTDPICGGIIENGEGGPTHGSIKSPGYPGKYPHERDCVWQIKAGLGKRLQLVFATFQLEQHPNCSYDYLEIRDGLEDHAPILEKLCNTTLPAPVTSSGPYLSVRFHSDDSSSDQGFLITYSEVPGIPGCGGLLTSATAVFSSPHHPQPYAHGLECDWLIRLPSSEDKISVTFLTFELEDNSGFSGTEDQCVFDYVEIHDGPNIDSPLLGRFCGGTLPPGVKSKSNQLFVRFKSDESVALGGFSAKYETLCGGELTSPDGILRSPFYPSNYPKLRDCVYVINQPTGKGINLQFLDFDIEPGIDVNCYFDYLEIRDGDTENSTLIGHYCGPPQAAPEIVTSSFNYLWIRFKTDGSVQNRGFLANYSTFDTGCGGILRNPHGSIATPGHPEVYPHGVQCMWVIRGVPGQVVRLTWDVFNLESSSDCVYDYVEIYDNSTSFVNGSLAGRFCGQEHPPVITSTDTTLTIIFKSDHSAAFDGFMASYRILNATTVCGGNFFTEYGVITSPRYPENYPNSKSCTWIITAPRGRQIELNVTDFDLENSVSSGCRYDFLEIRNGGTETSPLVGKFCGNREPPTIIPSFTNSLYLKFKTDSSHSRKGFKIVWDATSTGCGGVLNSLTGSITSPSYPSASGGVDCVWKINVNQGSSIQITFVDIDVQHSSSSRCWGERVEVFDGVERNSPSLGKFCSEDHMISVQSTGSSVLVKYISSLYGNGRGFKLNYRSVCTRTLKGFQGVIESPNYPNPYPHNRNCTWTIAASRGSKVNISFSHFEVEAPYRGNCSYDFVQISEWKRFQDENKTTLGTYCGSHRPRLISSTKDTVAISFVSDYSHASNGFRLEWRQYGCGGRIIGDYSLISSPNYPKVHPHNIECIWEVTSELGTKPKLTIFDLDLESGGEQCQWDGLEVYGGPDASSPLLSKMCRSFTSPRTVTSHGNNMYIRFYSDSSVAYKGFQGYVSQIADGCGGNYRGSGFIYSPNYPNNYDHNDDCTWLISVSENHVVELEFKEFDIERHINCTFDHIAVYDGSWSSAPLLLMHCGNTLPDPPIIKATGNVMLVRLKTDGSAAGKGFKAQYREGCGARLTGQQSGVITTPNFPRAVSSLLGKDNCSWIIEGSSPDDRITLTFTYMDFSMNTENGCVKNYVEVFDGDEYDAPSLYKDCSGRIPPSLTSRGNTMMVHIQFQDYYGHGFRAVYDMASSACGGMLTSANGSISSPNYPNGYPANAECIWTIKASVGNRVQLSFRQFNVESSEFCNSDFVEIHEGKSSGPLLGHYCGSEVPSNITAAEQIWILFRTDAEGQAPGFLADFTLLHGAELSGSSGSIASPMYGIVSSYSGTGTFYWRVTVNESYSIEFTFAHYQFDTYDELDNCDYYDTITIYDGFDENSPVLQTICRIDKPDPVITTGNVAYIIYKRTTWSNSFLLQWQQVQGSMGGASIYQRNVTGCGGNFSIAENNVTTLLSPGFPYGAIANLNCDWSFDSPPNTRILLKVEAMGLEGYQDCIYDRVELFDGARGLPNYNLNKTLCYAYEVNKTYLSSGRFLRVVFKTDSTAWRYRQGFNFSLSTVCGGYVRGSRGAISSPNYPNNYIASNCIWKVVVRPGRTIRVTFNPSFEIYTGGGGQCITDQLILRNGGNEESPFLGSGRYCGTTAPPTLETSGNHLFVHFSAWTHATKGFALTYEEVSFGCGGNVQLTDNAPSTNIQSPNFPNIPPPFTECEWIFTVPQGEAVQVNFLASFDINYSPGCQNAGVEVRDGGTAIASELGIFCRDMPGTLKSTGNVLYLRYYTNMLEPRTGFKAEVKIATCGGVHSGRFGTISSPGFPSTYEVNLDCLWTIRSPRGTYIVLEFTNFNLGESEGNCTKDKINITEQSSADMIEPRNWTFCGSNDGVLPNWIQSGTNEIQIRFTSDGERERQQNGMGFKLRYRARTQYCGQSLRTPTGFITSPNYPRPYPEYVYCVWRIYAPAGRRIRIEFTDFDLEEKLSLSSGFGCHADQLWIYQGILRAVKGALYNTTLCGSTLPAPVETTSNEATIYFRTDGSIAHRGFKLRYTTDLPIICGGTLEGPEGTIASPNSTTNTPNTTTNVFCEWKTENIQQQSIGWSFFRPVVNGTTIVTLNSLRLPSWGTRDPLCSLGFLRVSPTSTYIRYKWRKLCGTFTNEKIYLPGNSLHVEYVTDDANSTFNMSYRTVPCGGSVHGPVANISSLNYPSAYPINTECIWTVNFASSSQVKIHFLDLDLDDHQGSEGCDKDYVIIRNGQYPSSPQIGKFCGTYIPNDIISMSNELWIEFHSDGNADGSRKGFQLSLETVTKGCGGVIHKKFGQLASPKVDLTSNRYPHNTECEWIIESIPGYMINLAFFDRFELENSTNCTNDFVQVFSKLDDFNWASLGKFCGRQIPSPINTTSSTVKILFKSNANLNGDGFKMYWYSPCGGLFTGSEGIIRSAHYDSMNHSQHINPGRFWGYFGWESIFNIYTCNYLVQGDPNDYIMIKFLEPFEIRVPEQYAVRESDLNAACPRVNLTAWEGNFTNVPRNFYEYKFNPVCGRTAPSAFVVRGSAVLSYNYLPAYENFGFKAQYNRYDCGGEIASPRRIQSPGNPFSYTGNMNCTWVVRGPPNKVIRFQFLFLDIEQGGTCGWDAVQIYDGPIIDESKLLGTYCGNLTEELPKINSKSNSMTVYFRSDGSVHYRGFEGGVDFTVGEPQGCGGMRNLSLGHVTLSSIDTNGDGKYDENLDCQWLLVAPEFKSIELTFASFNLEDSRGIQKFSPDPCPWDFLEVRDGPGPHSQLLAKLCGQSVPSAVISSQNFMWIRFATDGSNNFPGFTFTASDRPSPCGQLVFNASESMQYLQSPGYPSNYQNNVRCRWRIDAPRYYQEVDITFVDIDIEPAVDCGKDRLEVKDVAATSYSTPEGIGGPALFVGSVVLDWRFRHLNMTIDTIMQNYKYCGSQTPPDFYTVARSAEIFFSTDASTSRKGFKLGYKIAGCNRTYENLQGRVFSPEWPTHTPIYSNCLSSIRAPNGSLISLYFNFFSLPQQAESSSAGCSEAAVQVRDGGPSGTLLAQYCGTSIPDPVFSVTNFLYIKFFSRSHPVRGYDITYTTTDMGRGCGGNIFHTGGSLTSPMYPGNYSKNSDCVWRVRVPGGLRIQIQFTNFMFSGNCQTDFLEISSLDSHDPSATPVLFSRFCPGDVPGIYSGTTDTAVVRYKTSTNNTGAGWRATFKGVYPSDIPVESMPRIQ